MTTLDIDPADELNGRLVERELARLTAPPAPPPAPVLFDPPPQRQPARLGQLLDTLCVEVRRLGLLVDREQGLRRRAEARVVELEREVAGFRRRDAVLAAKIGALRADLRLVAVAKTAHRPVESAPPVARRRRVPPPIEFAHVAPAAPNPTRPANGWLADVFGRLIRRDPAWAGQLLVALLPLQDRVHPEPIAYDIGHIGGWLHVTVSEEGCRVQRAAAPRPPREVRFAIDATRDDLGLARVLAAGARRRRWGLGLPLITGDRSGVAALDALLGLRVSLAEIHAAGIRLHPRLVLKLVATMRGSEPGPEAFTLAWESPDRRQGNAALLVRERELRLGHAARPTTTVVCDADKLLGVLAGVDSATYAVRGDPKPLDLVRRWVAACQFHA